MKKLLYILLLLPVLANAQISYQKNGKNIQFNVSGGSTTGSPGGNILADVGIKCGTSFSIDSLGRTEVGLHGTPLMFSMSDSAFDSPLPVLQFGANRFDENKMHLGVIVAADSDSTGETSWGSKNYQTNLSRHIKAKYQSDEKYLIIEAYDSPTQRQHMDINPLGFAVSQWQTGSKVTYQFGLTRGAPGQVYGMVSADSSGFVNSPTGLNRTIILGEESGFTDAKFVGSTFTQLFVDGSLLEPVTNYTINTSTGAITFLPPLMVGNSVSCIITYH